MHPTITTSGLLHRPGPVAGRARNLHSDWDTAVVETLGSSPDETPEISNGSQLGPAIVGGKRAVGKIERPPRRPLTHRMSESASRDNAPGAGLQFSTVALTHRVRKAGNLRFRQPLVRIFHDCARDRHYTWRGSPCGRDSRRGIRRGRL